MNAITDIIKNYFDLNKRIFDKTDNQKGKVNENVIQYKEAPYDYYLEYLKEQGWFCNTINLSNLSSVTKYSLEKDKYGLFLDIRCPAGKKLVFPGIKQFNFDIKHFSEYPNLYGRPYSFSLICKDKKGNELDYNRVIRIEKVITSEVIINITNELYGDLNIKYNEKYKKLNERFYFKDGFELNGEEHLMLYTKPDIDIDCNYIEVFGKADSFKKL